MAAGRVDTIGSDHSPSPPEMKKSADFFGVWGGIAGIQSTLRILLTLDLSPRLITTLVSENPARRFRIPGKGAIRVGSDADISLVDLSGAAVLRTEELLSRHRLSPYIGRALRGDVKRTFVRGLTVFRDGKMTGDPVGRFVRPSQGSRPIVEDQGLPHDG